MLALLLSGGVRLASMQAGAPVGTLQARLTPLVDHSTSKGGFSK